MDVRQAVLQRDKAPGNTPDRAWADAIDGRTRALARRGGDGTTPRLENHWLVKREIPDDTPRGDDPERARAMDELSIAMATPVDPMENTSEADEPSGKPTKSCDRETAALPALCPENT